jgi:hypothetical protein
MWKLVGLVGKDCGKALPFSSPEREREQREDIGAAMRAQRTWDRDAKTRHTGSTLHVAQRFKYLLDAHN